MKIIATSKSLASLSIGVSLMALEQSTSSAVTFQLDYTYDTNNFFSPGSAERTVLESAAAFVGNLIVDDLDAISPDRAYVPFLQPGWNDPGNSWRATFQNPSDVTQSLNEDFLSVPADTLIVYAGAYDFAGGQLAEGGFGGKAVFGTTAFNTTVTTRGEIGGVDDEFSPWGGYISVENTDTMWDLSIDGSTLDPGETHLYSVLIHEFAHVLGIGTAQSWISKISGATFTGTEAVSVFGSAVPTEGTLNDHFLDGIMSNIYGTTTPQEPSLSEGISEDQIKLFTELDVAALDDIGWDIIAPVPEPSVASLLALFAATLTLRRRR